MTNVKPALSAEEWKAGGFDNGCGFGMHWNDANNYFEIYHGMHPQRLVRDGWIGHAIAAACLHGQPFGFTREDVLTIRRERIVAQGAIQGSGKYAQPEALAHLAALESLESRIAALLPPETP